MQLIAPDLYEEVTRLSGGACAFGLAVADLTTGSFKAAEVENESMLLTELERWRPTEIIVPAEAASLHALLKNAYPILNGYDDWVFAPETAVPGWAFLGVAMFFLGGIQMIMLGVLGSYIGRTYSQVQNRPLYGVASVRTGTPDREGLDARSAAR